MPILILEGIITDQGALERAHDDDEHDTEPEVLAGLFMEKVRLALNGHSAVRVGTVISVTCDDQAVLNRIREKFVKARPDVGMQIREVTS